MNWPDILPDLQSWIGEVRGRLIPNQLLSEITWFRVGGPAQLYFQPADEADLQFFLKNLPADIKVTVIGLGSNLLVRDGGLEGVVIRLSARGFGSIEVLDNHRLRIGCALPDVRVANAAAEAGIDGLTFYRGIPGGIGGALYMNAGCYGTETRDRMVELRGVSRDGEIVTRTNAEMGYRYRHSEAPEGVVFTSAVYQGFAGDPDDIKTRMKEITETREGSQPVKSRTGGSTFKNPEGHSSWKLIDAAGCRGLRIGNAQVSEMHCNFLINLGEAGAFDIETLGETVRNRVRENSGIALDWEIRRMGRFAPDHEVREFLDGDVFPGHRVNGRGRIALVSGGRYAAAAEDIAGSLTGQGFDVAPVEGDNDIAPKLAGISPDIVFVASMKPQEGDGRLQGVCEAMALPYTHSGVAATALANDRHLAKLVFKSAGIPVTDHVLADRKEVVRTHALPPPYIVKSRHSGAGGAAVVARHAEELLPDGLLGEDWADCEEVMIERFLPGVTFDAYIMGDVLLGISATTDAIGDRVSALLIPASISPKIYEECTRLALRAYRVLGCRGVASVALRYDERQAAGNPVVLGLDPQPDMSKNAPLSQFASRAGHSFDELLRWIVQDASCGRMG